MALEPERVSIATCERVRLTLAQRLRHAPRGEADERGQGPTLCALEHGHAAPCSGNGDPAAARSEGGAFEGRSPRSQHRHELTARDRPHVRRATVGEDRDEVPGGRVERDVRDGVPVARRAAPDASRGADPTARLRRSSCRRRRGCRPGRTPRSSARTACPSPVDTDATCAPSATRQTRSVPSPAAARRAPPGEKATPSTLENPPSRRISFPVRQRQTRTSPSSPAAAMSLPSAEKAASRSAGPPTVPRVATRAARVGPPYLDRPIVPRGEHVPPVRTEARTLHPLISPITVCEHVHDASALQVPHARRLVLARGHELLAPRSKAHVAQDLRGGRGEHGLYGVGGDRPRPDHAVRGAGDDRSAVGREGGAEHEPAMAQERGDRRPAAAIPDRRRLVLARSGQRRAVRAEGKARDCPLVSAGPRPRLRFGGSRRA